MLHLKIKNQKILLILLMYKKHKKIRVALREIKKDEFKSLI